MSADQSTDLREYYDAKALEFDELAVSYESEIAYKRFFYGARFEAVMAALEPRADERILEIGCGTGYYTRAILELGATVTATEYAPNYLEQARRLVGPTLARSARFHVEDAQALSLQDASFDKILMTEVIEHLPQPEQALAECARVLAPHGRLVITTPSRYSPMNLAYGLKRRARGYAFNEHLHEYTIPEFRRTLDRWFVVERLRFANYLVPYPFDSLFLRAGSRSTRVLGTVEAAMARLPLLKRTGWTMIATARARR